MANNSVASSVSQQQQPKRMGSNKNHQDRANESSSAPSSTEELVQSKTTAANGNAVIYDVEHLATFSTAASHETNSRCTNNDVNSEKSEGTTGGGIESSHSATGEETVNNNNNGTKSVAATTTTKTINPTTTSPKVALQRLFELEKLSGIWTQRMQIELRLDVMLIVDCETNATVERFSRECVTKPEAFNEYNDIYNNIVVFMIQQNQSQSSADQANEQADSEEETRPETSQGELHIFQCVSHKAQQLVSDILAWKIQQEPKNMASDIGEANSQPAKVSAESRQAAATERQNSTSVVNNASSKKASTSGGSDKPVVTMASSANGSENVPIVNVNVKETVQVFNQIAASREKGKPSSPTQTQQDGGVAGSASTTANTDLVRTPLSPGGQFYKQRSIRATLAPKFNGGADNGSGKQPQAEKQQSGAYKSAEAEPSSSFNSASTASSSSVASSEAINNKPASNQSASSGSRSNGYGHVDSNLLPVGRPQSMPTANGGHHKSNKSSRSQPRSQSDSSRSQASSSYQSHIDQVTTNESYVSVLNHCFDDIEKFIIRLQQAASAIRELQTKKKLSKRSSSNGFHDAGPPAPPANLAKGTMANPAGHHHHHQASVSSNKLPLLNVKARGPSEDDYFEILSKFKLAFNLLAKLKGCIHEPNAPELVHFLFTPLAIIIDSARNATPPINPTLVGIPYLNQDALDLLSNCCTSKESDLWFSLGSNWTQTIDVGLLKASRLPSSFQPIFSDGWAPIIGELDLIGLALPPSASVINDCSTVDSDIHHHQLSHQKQQQKGRRVSHPANSYLINDLAEGPAAASYPASTADPSLVYSAGLVGGKGRMMDKSKSGGGPNGAVRDYKRGKALSPQPPPMEPPAAMAAHPQLSPDSYSYMQHQHHHHRDHAPLAPNIDPMGRDQVSFRGSNHSRNIRFGADGLAQNRRTTKQSSRHNTKQDYGYELAHYPAIGQAPLGCLPSLVDGGEGHNLDVDLISQQNGRLHHSDDYTELHEPYMANEHRPAHNLAGPSHPSYHRGDNNFHARNRHSHHMGPYDLQSGMMPPYETDYMSEAEHEAMLLDFGPAQTEWFFELQARGALIVRVLFSREANNDKELSVRRGEILEVLDDSRKWWRARNIDLQVAHVPHTIVAVMNGYQTLDELLANNPGDGMVSKDPSLYNSQGYSRRDMQPVVYGNPQQWQDNEDKRNSKTAGAFRYF